MFHLARQAFPIPESERANDRERFKPELNLVAEVDGEIMARAVSHPMGHWFGGRNIPSAGIAGVAVSPEARGRGLGTQLVRRLLDDAIAEGKPISALYPATIPIYRSLGYGDAFHRTTLKAELSSLPRNGGETVSIREMRAGDLPELMAGFDRFAATTSGLAARSESWWTDRVLTEQTPFRYLAYEGDQLTGWMLYSTVQRKDDWMSDLLARDLTWTTRETARALLTVASLHRSTCRELRWNGPLDEPLYSVMHDHAIDISHSFRAMLRLLDVPGALTDRGYPRTLDAEVTLAVTDPERPGNEGPWRLSFSKGELALEPTEAAPDATVTVEGLASIYSSLLIARDAARVGFLRATPEAIEVLEAAFTGPTPWLADFF